MTLDTLPQDWQNAIGKFDKDFWEIEVTQGKVLHVVGPEIIAKVIVSEGRISLCPAWWKELHGMDGKQAKDWAASKGYKIL